LTIAVISYIIFRIYRHRKSKEETN
jgi:hypothetical protein